MGKRGPRQPLQLRALKGGAAKRELAEAPMPAPSLPEPPPWLNEVGADEWNRLAPELYAQGLLSGRYQTAFAMYCEAYARYVELTEWLQEHPDVEETHSGYRQQAPEVVMRNKAYDQMLRALREFGMTPASVSEVTAKKRGRSSEEERAARLLG